MATTAFVPTPLVGRRAELQEIERLLGRSRVVTVVGPGGMGKTRVAQEVARAKAGPVWWVELADVVENDLVVHNIAETVGVDPGEPGLELEHLCTYLAATSGMLVLDNCEHLVDAVGSLVASLVARTAGVSVLATSRTPLTITPEIVYDLPPLSTPAPDQVVTPSTLARYDAAGLFVERARTASATFEVTEGNADAIARLAAELDGLPLALELAAARVRMFSPEVILERIGSRYRLLRHDSRDTPGRLRSLAASMAWSYDLCSPGERALWSRLSVFVGGFDIPAAEQVCGGEGIREDDVLDLLAALVDRSVVQRSPDDPTRYRMLESIRQYGVARLTDEEADAWRTRHRDWCAALTSRAEAEWIGADQVGLLRTLRTEYANLRAALERATASPDAAPVALQMCRWLEPLWIADGQLGEGRVWLGRALEHRTGTDSERALALRAYARLAGLQADFTAAGRALDEARAIPHDESSDLHRGDHLFVDGFLRVWQEDVEQGLAMLGEGVSLLHRAGWVRGHLQGLGLLGLCQAVTGDRAGALQSHREGIAAAAPHREIINMTWVVWGLGLCSLDSDDLRAAADQNAEALRNARALENGLMSAAAVEAFGWVAAAEGDSERAARLRGAADALWNRMTFPLSESPFFAVRREACDQRARADLGPSRFEARYAEGSRMSLENVLALALGGDPPGNAEDDATPLTRRETEIADLVADGCSNREIAERLVISERTVHGHMEKILQKLGFRSRVQVAAWVAERRNR